jgi:inner membrane protein
MDTLTHIALGACIGELFSDRKFVKKAMLWGALAQSIPDIDFISVAWLGPTEALIAHRGFTHSILFGILITFFLAVTAERFHRPHNISLKKWIFFLGTEVAVHLLIDAFNNYGVGWFEPFWDKRISLHTIFVVDPFFSIPSGIACLALFLLHTDHKHRIKWAGAGISLTAIYLLYALSNKSMVTSDIREIAQKQHIDYNSKRAFTTPTPFNTWLWFVVIEEKDGYQIGYRSLFDSDDSLKLNYFPRNENLLGEIRNHVEVTNLKKFSQGYYTVEKRGDTLVFNDLRFGQEIGWYDPTQPFAFHYYLSHPDDNELVVQRGRFSQWNETTFKSFLNRIRGF